MNKVMIVLVSAQRMQNIIPVYQENMGPDDLIVPIISKKGDQLNEFFIRVYKQIQDALKGKVEALSERLEDGVRPMFPADTKAVCSRLLDQYAGEEVIVNITGGLKPMAIGAYLAAEGRAHIIYVDTENEQIVTLEPDGRVSTPEFNQYVASIDAEVYLRAHGKELDLHRIEQNAFTEADLEAGFALGQVLDQAIPFLDSLRTAADAQFRARGGQAKQQPVDIPLCELKVVDSEVLNIICPGYAKLSQREGILTIYPGSRWNFLTGGWFEAYVYRSLKESGLFHDVRSKVYLKGMDDDLDALCVYNARLAILECKSGRGRGKQGPLHRLNMLQGNLAGIFGKAIFVTTRRHRELGKRFQERAKETRTRVIVREELTNLAEIVHKRLKEPR